MKNWLLVISLLLLVPNFFSGHIVKLSQSGITKETFDPVLANNLKSVTAMTNYIDSLANKRSAMPGSDEYSNLLSSIMFKRFSHGYSHYSMDENWMSALAGGVIWYNLSAIATPDDIMKYSMAACSQQGLVLMEIFRRKKIPYRVVNYDHHFAVEGQFNDRWQYFDTDINPVFSSNQRSAYASLITRDKALQIYKGFIPASDVDSILANPHSGKINLMPGKNIRMFHSVTGALSHWLWLLPLVTYISLFFKASPEWKIKKSSTSLTTV